MRAFEKSLLVSEADIFTSGALISYSPLFFYSSEDVEIHAIKFCWCKYFNVILTPQVDENSPLGAIVGVLSSQDPDNLKSQRQTFTYSLVDTAQGRFKLSGNSLQVSKPCSYNRVFY